MTNDILLELVYEFFFILFVAQEAHPERIPVKKRWSLPLVVLDIRGLREPLQYMYGEESLHLFFWILSDSSGYGDIV